MPVRIIQLLLLVVPLLYAVFPCVAASPPLPFTVSAPSLSLAGHLDILEDRTGALTIEQVSAPAMADRFIPDPRSAPHFGYTSRVYWVRFTIAGDPAGEKSRLLELDIPHMKYLDLYVPRPGGGFEALRAGSMRPMSVRAYRHRKPVFPLVIGTKAATFYLRLDARGWTMMPLTLWKPEEFARADNRTSMIHGGYFGAILALFAYNLCVFFSLRDRNYLYYILDIICLGLYVFFSSGFLLEYVSGDMPRINEYAVLLAVPVNLSGLIFCRRFLDTARALPHIDRVIKALMLLALLSIPAAFILSPERWRVMMTTIAICSSLTNLASGLLSLRGGYRPARYYVAARCCRVFGTLSYALGASGVLFINRLTIFFSLQAGSICEALLLSFALADRIALMQREKEKEMLERNRLKHEILHISEEERRRISHDLHDGLCQQLSSALLRCSLLEEKLAGDVRYHAELTQLSSLLEESVDHAYDLSRGLWPVEQDAYGLGRSLEELTRRLAGAGDIGITFTQELSCAACRFDGAAQLYRIAQEALTNAVKHSGASHIEVTLTCRERRGFILTVRDNGAGRPTAATSKGGMGMGIMAYRAGAAGGSLNIADAEGGGTLITCVIPCEAGLREE